MINVLLAGIFTWLTTGLGGLGVFLFNRPNPKFFSISLGFSAGVMIAASFWSLLVPALEIAKASVFPPFVSVSIGFILGVLFLRLLDLVVPHLHLFASKEETEGFKVSLNVSVLVFLAITLHNIPEGLAIGVAFGSVNEDTYLLKEAINLALGIGIQNIPEGLALGLTLKFSGMSKFKAFYLSFFSAIVEPIFALVGFGIVSYSSYFLPYALSFAAGAMIFVTIEELLPEAQKAANTDYSSLGFGLGFLIMMSLDTYLG
ncbi:ZIP family metal transporter [Thermodesulfobacterium sp. TA1]|uniref:ZIP family metal transporter n=1 Tax=Thermodesulfobacterium sp. TA1 TaxID=2234087 RepID=UPI001231BDE9|nr:ZIP family metal transporter [Thermodesulfobacterium sp. TA1]QER42206.1 ZIP family metal transporter [Thermodesulfobacterium sp. TA1]